MGNIRGPMMSLSLCVCVCACVCGWVRVQRESGLGFALGNAFHALAHVVGFATLRFGKGSDRLGFTTQDTVGRKHVSSTPRRPRSSLSLSSLGSVVVVVVAAPC